MLGLIEIFYKDGTIIYRIEGGKTKHIPQKFCISNGRDSAKYKGL